MTKLDRHYVDPRLVELYDIENPRGIDTDFYVQLTDELGAETIVDLGCGTGTLTCELASDRRRIIGVDPTAAMLAVARRKPGAEQVQWIKGDSRSLGTPDADLAVMTGNVAQVFLDDAEWLGVLRDIHAAIRPGGFVAFESRNPAVREWEQWTRETTRARYNTPQGQVECWVEVTDVGDGRISCEGHNVFAATGETIVAVSVLRFRTHDELVTSLTGAGFHIEHVFGNWRRKPFAATDPIMVFVARRA